MDFQVRFSFPGYTLTGSEYQAFINNMDFETQTFIESLLPEGLTAKEKKQFIENNFLIDFKNRTVRAVQPDGSIRNYNIPPPSTITPNTALLSVVNTFPTTTIPKTTTTTTQANSSKTSILSFVVIGGIAVFFFFTLKK